MALFRRDFAAQVAAALAAVLMGAQVLLYANSLAVGAETLTWFNAVANPLAALGCAALAFLLWRSFNKSEPLRRVWGFLGVGLLMWGIAEIIFAWFDVTGGEVPVPSLADALWVPGYLPLFAGLWLRYVSLRIALPRWQIIGLGLATLVAAAVSVYFVISPNVALSEGDPASIALSVLYPVGDLLIVLGVGLTALALFGGELSRPWLIVAAGFLSIAVADSLYYYGYASGTYDSEATPISLVTAISDICYLGGYTLAALGTFAQARLQKAL